MGFDDTAPNRAVDISSWAWDLASRSGVPVRDNRAKQVLCYLPAYTFVEKLQTISTKYRKMHMASGANGVAHGGQEAISKRTLPNNFLRHYYDVYCLLAMEEVQAFLSTETYQARKQLRFRQADELRMPLNTAFSLPDARERTHFSKEFSKTAALYYRGQPSFEDILTRIRENLPRL